MSSLGPPWDAQLLTPREQPYAASVLSSPPSNEWVVDHPDGLSSNQAAASSSAAAAIPARVLVRSSHFAGDDEHRLRMLFREAGFSDDALFDQAVATANSRREQEWSKARWKKLYDDHETRRRAFYERLRDVGVELIHSQQTMEHPRMTFAPIELKRDVGPRMLFSVLDSLLEHMLERPVGRQPVEEALYAHIHKVFLRAGRETAPARPKAPLTEQQSAEKREKDRVYRQQAKEKKKRDAAAGESVAAAAASYRYEDMQQQQPVAKRPRTLDGPPVDLSLYDLRSATEMAVAANRGDDPIASILNHAMSSDAESGAADSYSIPLLLSPPIVDVGLFDLAGGTDAARKVTGKAARQATNARYKLKKRLEKAAAAASSYQAAAAAASSYPAASSSSFSPVFGYDPDLQDDMNGSNSLAGFSDAWAAQQRRVAEEAAEEARRDGPLFENSQDPNAQDDNTGSLLFASQPLSLPPSPSASCEVCGDSAVLTGKTRCLSCS